MACLVLEQKKLLVCSVLNERNCGIVGFKRIENMRKTCTQFLMIISRLGECDLIEEVFEV